MSNKRAMSDEQEEVLDKKSLLDLTRFLLILKRCIELGISQDKIGEGLALYKINIKTIEEMGDLLFQDVVVNAPRLNPMFAKYKMARKSFDVDSLDLRIPLLEGFLKHLHLNPQEISEFAEKQPAIVNYVKDLNLGVLEKKTLESLKLLINMPTFLFLKSGVRSPQEWLNSLVLDNVTSSSKTEQIDQMLAINQGYVNIANDIKDLDTKIRSLNPNTEEFKEEQKKRKDLLEKLIDEVQSNEGNQAQSILVSLTGVIHSTSTHQTDVGKRLNLTPEQENAMIVNGKSIIAAGAGSGKTRVLAGRVAWLLQEKGVNSENIMATSFTTNSAEELKERIEKPEFAGSNSIRGGGFGTSHSIANGILMRYSKGNNKVDFNLDSKLIRIAKNQVRFSNGNPNTQKMPNNPLFNIYSQNDINNYITMINNFMDFANYYLNQPSTSPQNKELLKKDISLLNEITSKKLLPYDLSVPQKDYLNSMIASDRGKMVFGKLLRDYKLSGLDRLQKISFDKTASEEDSNADQPYLDLAKESSRKSKGKLPKESIYFESPANMWFNLGLNDVMIKVQAEELNLNGLYTQSAKLDEDYKDFKKKLESSYFDKKVSAFYNNAFSPKQVKESLSNSFLDQALVAIYGAFLWLKENDLTFRGYYSGDDMLIKAIGLMLEQPSVLSSLQNQYEHIMVDEAQDLNRGQHLFFGLIAGTINPGNLLPYTDGRPMKAKSFVLIGDDKQAIYEFRGATPKSFMEKSKLLGGDFETAIIPTNFRSGSDIVDAANKLISHNEQIPMTCVSVPSKGTGNIYCHETNDSSFAKDAIETIDEVKNHIALGGKAEDYGVATRSKNEAYPFLLEALKYKVPFRSQINPLTKPNFQAVFKWLEFISLPDTAVDQLNDFVFELHKTGPVFFLGEKNFNEPLSKHLQQNKNANLLKNFPFYIFPSTERALNKNIKAYMDVLSDARKINGNPEHCFKTFLQLEDVKDNRRFQDILFPAKDLTARDPDEEEDLSKDYDIMMTLLNFENDPSIKNLADAMKELKKYNEGVLKAMDEKKGMLIDTMHQWKGLECKHLVTVFSNYFPRKKPKKDQTIEEWEEGIKSDRRLAYVALTRGQDSVKVLSNTASKEWDEKSKSYKTNSVEKSSFIEEACVRVKYSSGKDDKKKKKSSEDRILAEDFLNSLIFRK